MACAACGQEISRRLVVMLRGERTAELLRYQVFPHKERINARQIAAGQPVSLAFAEPLQRLQACAEVPASVPPPTCLVWLYPFRVRKEDRVILDDDNSMPVILNGRPNVIVIAVDVDRQDIELARNVGSPQEAHDGCRCG